MSFFAAVVSAVIFLRSRQRRQRIDLELHHGQQPYPKPEYSGPVLRISVLPKELGHPEGQIERLAAVQTGVADGLVAVVEVGLAQRVAAPGARDLLAGGSAAGDRGCRQPRAPSVVVLLSRHALQMQRPATTKR